jgi:hypothetical protein
MQLSLLQGEGAVRGGQLLLLDCTGDGPEREGGRDSVAKCVWWLHLLVVFFSIAAS